MEGDEQDVALNAYVNLEHILNTAIYMVSYVEVLASHG
jgi:hypothetical protein